MSYAEALTSLWRLVVEQPVLREASVVGFLIFAAFSSFWTNLAFLLGSPHYRLGAGVAGSFGNWARREHWLPPLRDEWPTAKDHAG